MARIPRDALQLFTYDGDDVFFEYWVTPRMELFKVDRFRAPTTVCRLTVTGGQCSLRLQPGAQRQHIPIAAVWRQAVEQNTAEEEYSETEEEEEKKEVHEEEKHEAEEEKSHEEEKHEEEEEKSREEEEAHEEEVPELPRRPVIYQEWSWASPYFRLPGGLSPEDQPIVRIKVITIIEEQ